MNYFVFRAQMRSSVPNTSGKTRFSIDFRVVHEDDVKGKKGAPIVYEECTGDDHARLYPWHGLGPYSR
jgi:hypothetical protein